MFCVDRSRVVRSGGQDEANFHLYEAVLHHPSLRSSSGAPPMLRDFTMLASHASRADGARRAAADLAAVGDALGAAGLGLGGRERRHFWCVVEGMLHLGNLHFDDDEGAAGGGGDSDAVGGGGAAGGGGGGGGARARPV